MGGSQLTQLRAKLRDSGLNRQANPKDARKRAKQRKDLSSNSAQHRNAKLAAIHDQFNVFDTRDEKKKFQVVSRSGKEEGGGTKGMPGRARAAGIEARKKTLLPMLEARTHASTFVDHRFGEAASHLTPEEKALERFTAERKSRLDKKMRFNLEDDDGGEFALTHGGRKLGFGDEDQLEDGGWGGLGEGANREPLMNRRKMGAEPEEDEEPRKKSHAEIMDEVIAKSKFHKAERQKMKSADDETRLELDAELKDLRGILAGGAVSRGAASEKGSGSSATGAPEPAEDDEEEDEDEEDDEDEEEDVEDGDDSDADSDESGSTYELNDEELEAALAASSAKSGVDRDLLRKLIGSAADRSPSPSPPPASRSASAAVDGERPPPAKSAADDDDEDSKDPYDIYVRELALEPRAHATNRLKTPLELAQEAAEQLKKQEERRLKRQRGEEDRSSDEEDGAEDGKRKQKEKKRAPQGDDLDDDFLEEQYGSDVDESAAPAVAVGGLGQGLEGEGVLLADEDGSAEGSDEEEGEEDGSEGEEDEEQSEMDEMDVGDLDATDSEEEEAAQGETEALVAPSTAAFDKSGELPYTFPCPTTHAEFAKLLRSSGIKDEDTITVVKRIRTLYHPGLAEGNKEKLQVFANVLLDHIVYLCTSPSPSTFATVNSLLPQLLTMSHAYPLSSAPHYVTKLSLMHRNLLRGLIRGPLDPAAKTWPGLAELTLLRLIGMVWSTSDLSHPVAAPALLLIGEYLSQARVRSLSDLASGIFLVSLVAQFEEQSKRIVPEAVNFLANSLALLFPTTSAVSATSFPGFFPAPDVGQEHAKQLKLGRDSSSLEPSKSINLLEALAAKGKNGKGKASAAEAAQLKVDLAASALKLVETYRAMYSESEAFIEVFRPIEAILKAVKLEKLSPSLQNNVKSTLDALSRSLTFAGQSRRPLFLQHHKPIPLATYLPKFDEGFNPNRRFDPDSERAAASKLRALYKKEKKGAVRELRNDNKFLAVESAKRRAEEDQQYQRKIQKIVGSLQDERAEEKAFERTKAKGKRRDKARAGGR